MGYQEMQVNELYQIIKRWHQGHSLSNISRNTGKDRKTIRNYIQKAETNGIIQNDPLPDRQKLISILAPLIEKRDVKHPARKILSQHKDEIISLIQDKEHSVKAKTAYEIIQERYGISVSYESFKLFARDLNLKQYSKSVGYPLPLTDPGEVIEIDYGQVGRHHDGEKNRNVYAFTGILAHSRLPYIQFVYSQNSESFVESNIEMLVFYGGSAERIVLDNLKSGVSIPDKFNPQMNRAYADFAEHYGVFLDPARTYHPRDKAKVERMVPSARELFRKLRHLYPDATLKELNQKALTWCREEYGMRKHGTTGEKPFEAYSMRELKKLKPLPEERFVVPIWKEPKVHPDQFIQFEKKRYSLPSKYVGLTLQVKRVKNLLTIYHQHNEIRKYTVSKDKFRITPGDLPEHNEKILLKGFPGYVMSEAWKLGKPVGELIKQLLSSSHANLNIRNAQGMLKELKAHKDTPYYDTLCRRALDSHCHSLKHLKGIIALLEVQMSEETSDIPMSELGQKMTRDSQYLFKD